MVEKGTQSRALKMVIGGKEYPCRVTMGAMIHYKRDTGVDVSKLDTTDIESMVRFIWHCVRSACKADGIEFDLDFDEFADRLDPETLNRFYGEMAVEADEQKKTASQLA